MSSRGRVPKGSVPDALYWDTLDPYHYVRVQPDDDEHDWLLVGGEDHKTGQADDAKRRLAKLKTWAKPRFPSLGRIEHQWSGQVLDPVDYLPYSGVNPGNKAIFVHTGDSGQGLTNGVAGSLLLRELMLGKTHAWSKMYRSGPHLEEGSRALHRREHRRRRQSHRIRDGRRRLIDR